METLNTSIGICAHNEEKNIGKLLGTILVQRTRVAKIKQIIVVSSSNDRTNEIVESYNGIDRRIKLIVQKKREGKASAVNLFLKKAIGEVLVLESADTMPGKSTIEKLVNPFLNPNIGMTGGRPVPTNDSRTFMGFVSHFLWRMHHEVSKGDPENPKLGEIVAFRNIVRGIPKDTAVDEAWIEAEVRRKGFSCCYVSDAIVYNHGAENISDFLKQRRRIYSGHLHLKRKMGYETSTMKTTRILKVLPRALNIGWRKIPFAVGAAFLELYGRFLGAYDFYVRKKNPYIWDMAESTKGV